MAMSGFDAAFGSLDDYIRVITARIWEGREVEKIRDWYGADCAVITPGGTTTGVDTVIRGTLETLAQFPDRRLLCEDIVSAGDSEGGYLSSHRIASPMTHTGPGAFGPATGRSLFVRTIADCVCRNNRIEHEWLVRDQAAIAVQLGSNARELATRWLDTRGAPTLPLHQPAPPAWWHDPRHITPGAELLAATYTALWGGDIAVLSRHADEAIGAHLPAGETAVGVAALERFWFGLTAAFAGATLHIDSLAERFEPGRTPRVAMRWRVVGRHVGAGRYGAATGAPVEILGITHAEIDTRPGVRRILREWVLIDEVALWMQLLSA
jgi:predicted ester cyclase